MNWSFLITFFGGIGVYLIFLLVFSLFKRHRNKKKMEKEDKQREIAKDKPQLEEKQYEDKK